MNGNDGTDTVKATFSYNDITAAVSAIRFGMSSYSGTDTDVDIYCNKLNNTGTAGYPFYLNGTLSDILIDYNEITNSNSSGHEAWVDANKIEDAYEPVKIKSPAQLEKVLKKAKIEFPAEMVVSISSGDTLASDSDPRPAVLQIGKQLTAALSKL
jgi:hypothetical protein